MTSTDTVNHVEHVEHVKSDKSNNELKNIPIDDYLNKGYKPRIRTMDGHKYIALYKGNKTVSLGRYTPEKWETLILKTKQKPNTSHNYEDTEDEDEDEHIQKTIQGTTRGQGYMQEIKNMIREQISKTGELNQIFYNVGLGIITAALSKSGINIEQFRKIATQDAQLKEAFEKAAETAFKALEYYDQQKIEKLEQERDEARLAYTKLEVQVKKLIKELEPRAQLERLIRTYITTGNIDPNTLTILTNKLIELELMKIKNIP